MKRLKIKISDWGFSPTNDGSAAIMNYAPPTVRGDEVPGVLYVDDEGYVRFKVNT